MFFGKGRAVALREGGQRARLFGFGGRVGLPRLQAGNATLPDHPLHVFRDQVEFEIHFGPLGKPMGVRDFLGVRDDPDGEASLFNLSDSEADPIDCDRAFRNYVMEPSDPQSSIREQWWAELCQTSDARSGVPRYRAGR